MEFGEIIEINTCKENIAINEKCVTPQRSDETFHEHKSPQKLLVFDVDEDDSYIINVYSNIALGYLMYMPVIDEWRFFSDQAQLTHFNLISIANKLQELNS